ncbi:MAG: hypothetical protein F4160_08410 [Rhodospirillaceae bacterium]|nr:hypothetical protein [Rhodospirillaceae bacterium]MYH36808.1 hypothetical protein [Rhodospirillaceae bacterium]MYK15834.1 hypothetical protein [Rhodospirillaceae bacterium]
MTTMTEGNLRISFPQAAAVRRFDDSQAHGLSHCMKAVDFIVEETDRVLFIEIKDPEHPRSMDDDRQEFFDNFLSGRLDHDLKYKFRDTFIYEWASENLGKPLYYLVLIAIDSLTEPEILYFTDRLRQQLPINRSQNWSKEIAEGCTIFNIRTWNRNLPEYRVERIV